MLNDSIKAKGVVTIRSYRPEDAIKMKELMEQGVKVADLPFEPLEVETFNNLCVYSGKTMIANALVGITPLTSMKYLVIGDGAVAPVGADIKLGNERERIEITNFTIDTFSDIKILAEVFIGINQANFTWAELGLMCGGTTTKDSGTMFSRSLKAVTKTSLLTKTVSWEITLA